MHVKLPTPSFLTHFLLCFSLFVFVEKNIAQTIPKPRPCGSVIDWTALKADPIKWQKFQEAEARIREKARQITARVQADPNKEYEIPVVFHIVDPDPVTAVDDAFLEYQLAILNEDFQGQNEDSTNAPLFYPRRGRTKFRFVMAARDPNGCATTGITRKVSNITVTLATVGIIKHKSTGGTDMWDSYNSKYLNVWIGTFGPEPKGPFLGVATFPDGSDPADEQGVVIDKATLSFAGTAFTEGRTLVHEVGHYFFLRHIWGDEDACSDDDGVADTPLQTVSTSGKPIGLKTDPCSLVSPGINYQNYMDYTDDQGLTMFTKEQATRMLASLDLSPRSGLIDPDNKALVPPSPNLYFSMCTSPFTTNDFYAIGVGKNGYVWAGTSRQGIYRYNGSVWEKFGSHPDVLAWDIKADQKGGVWIAQSGRAASGGTTAPIGGLEYFSDTTFASNTYLSFSDGMPTRYARGLFIDTTRFNTGTNPLVWSAHMATTTGGSTLANGGVGRGLNASGNLFTSIREGLTVATSTQSVNAVGGNATEIWAIAPNNNSKTQILRYDANSNALLGIIDNTTNPGVFPSANFDARAVYFDKSNRKWIGLWTGGFVVNDGSNWYAVNNASIIPSTAKVNANAIVGDKKGNVYIGTDSGLIIYKGGNITADTNYKRYTKVNGLPGNNIRGISLDTMRKKIWLATDNGIVLWEPTCVGTGDNNLPYVTATNGDLSNPATWCGGVVPPPGSSIIVKHNLTIASNQTFKSMRAEQGGMVTVAAGVTVSLTQP